MLHRGSRHAADGNTTVDGRIASHATSEPDRIAVSHNGGNTSRANLERMAEALAQRLLAAGAEQDKTVAVCLPRGVQQIAACLAVLKIGAACLALSPQDSLEMLRFRLADCGVVLLVVQNERDPIVSLAAGAEVLAIDPALPTRIRDLPATASGSRPASVAWLASATCAGGASCGAEITHANVLLLADWLQASCGIGPRDRVCHMAEPGSSAAMLEVWPCLAAGATLVVMDDAIAASPVAIRAWLEAEAITAMIAGEDAIDALAQAPLGREARLRLVMTDAERARRYPASPSFRILATWGQDECTLVSAAHLVHRNERPGSPHIGRPIAGAAIHILDEDGQRVPLGQEGELWIAGAGVGHGYRNRPHLTAERFVPDPFGRDPAGMIFRTGHRGRALPGGAIRRSIQPEVC
ncbi:AMP-binding protein [Sphingomonas sp. PL-96]|nr:AMP-binding protein [Sphingomonas sp. PL-96]